MSTELALSSMRSYPAPVSLALVRAAPELRCCDRDLGIGGLEEAGVLLHDSNGSPTV